MLLFPWYSVDCQPLCYKWKKNTTVPGNSREVLSSSTTETLTIYGYVDYQIIHVLQKDFQKVPYIWCIYSSTSSTVSKLVRQSTLAHTVPHYLLASKIWKQHFQFHCICSLTVRHKYHHKTPSRKLLDHTTPVCAAFASIYNCLTEIVLVASLKVFMYYSAHYIPISYQEHIINTTLFTILANTQTYSYH